MFKIIGNTLLIICLALSVVFLIGLVVMAFYENVVLGAIIVSFMVALALGIVFSTIGD